MGIPPGAAPIRYTTLFKILDTELMQKMYMSIFLATLISAVKDFRAVMLTMGERQGI